MFEGSFLGEFALFVRQTGVNGIDIRGSQRFAWACCGRFAAACAIVFTLCNPALANASDRTASAFERVRSSLLLLIDISGSMGDPIGSGNPTIKIEAAKAAATAAVQRAVKKGEVEVAILAFEGGCDKPVSRQIDFTTNGVALTRFIDDLEPRGGTPMAEAVIVANRYMKHQGKSATARDQMIVLLADGQNDCGDVNDALATLKASGVIFRHETVGFGIEPNSAAARDLQNIATASGGTYHHAADATQLGDVFMEFVATLTVIDLLGTFQSKSNSGKSGSTP